MNTVNNNNISRLIYLNIKNDCNNKLRDERNKKFQFITYYRLIRTIHKEVNKNCLVNFRIRLLDIINWLR